MRPQHGDRFAIAFRQRALEGIGTYDIPLAVQIVEHGPESAEYTALYIEVM
jgi:hypothetical protein